MTRSYARRTGAPTYSSHKDAASNPPPPGPPGLKNTDPRRTRPEAERPYRCPGYPLVPALYVILPSFIVVNMFLHRDTIKEALAGVGLIALGAVVYGVFHLGRRPPSIRHSALSPAAETGKYEGN